jgi:hypothetical protein
MPGLSWPPERGSHAKISNWGESLNWYRNFVPAVPFSSWKKIMRPCLLIPTSFEESEDELDCSSASYNLMEKRSIEKSVLLELEREHQLKIQVCTAHSNLLLLR